MHKIQLHKTDMYPLPAMNINEASTTGNAEVVDALLRELEQDPALPAFVSEIKFLAGDQLSVV